MRKNLAIRRRLAKRVKRLRLDRGMSQERLAELADSSSSHISKIENGEIDVGVDSLARFAEALSVDVTGLFGPPPAGLGEALTQDENARIDEAIRQLQEEKRVRSSRRK